MLFELACPSYLEGRVTMEHYHAAAGGYVPTLSKPVGRTEVFVAETSEAYRVSVDTMGRLSWTSNRIEGLPLVCIVSEQASEAYLAR